MNNTITKPVRTASITRKQSRATIQSRDDLSFTVREGEDQRLNNWNIPVPCHMWGDGLAVGRAMFAEVKELARHSPIEAEWAIQFAITGSGFARNGRGEEDGFAKALAKHFTASLSLAKKLKRLQLQLADSPSWRHGRPTRPLPSGQNQHLTPLLRNLRRPLVLKKPVTPVTKNKSSINSTN